MRVVSYIRMSSARQELSPAQQRAAIEAHARKSNYVIVREYSDLGVSGDQTSKRPGFRQMIADGEAGQFDRILAYDRSRFGRFDSIEFGRWVSPLRDAGVELETIEAGVEDWEGFGGRVIGLVAQEAKHQFLVDMSRAVVRGQTAKALEGRGYAGPTPFGYVRHTTLQGRSRISRLEVDPAAAAVVRRIFEAYAAPDGSLHAIARALNQDGVAAIRGGAYWRKNTVQRVLLNEVYVGDAVWGRRRKGRYHARDGAEVVKRRRSAKVEFVEPIRHPDAVPAIISRELFARCQELLRSRAGKTAGPGRTRPLSGLVMCSACGRPMHSDGESFRCQSSAAHIGATERCPSIRVPSKPIMESLVAGIKKQLGSPAARAKLRRSVERALSAEADSRPARAGLEARHRQLAAEVAAGLERIPSMPAALVADYAASLERKAAERDNLAREIAAAPAAKGHKSISMVAAKMLDRIDDLVGRSLASGDPSTVNAALRSMGVKVVVSPKRLPVLASFTVGDTSKTGYQLELLPRIAWQSRIA